MRIKRSSLSKGTIGGAGLVFDRFKSWSNSNSKGIICPSCQHSNQEGTKVCTRCYYQIDRPSFQQSSGLGDDESTDLLDQLMSEFEEEEGEEEPTTLSFAFDDLTVEVSQYGEDDEVQLDRKPDFDSMIPLVDEVDEEYELTADDIPQFVQKFEVPRSLEEEDEVLIQRTIDLIQPNAETANFIQPLPPSEIIEANETGSPTGEDTGIEADDFDGDGKIDEFEEAFAKEPPSITNRHSIPPAPSVPIPKLIAIPVDEDQEPELPEQSVQLPSAPVLTSGERELTYPLDQQVNHSFWPWQQQGEWPVPEIIKQLQAAFRSAKEQNTAQTTVLLDEVGPHLGNRTSLIYSVGKLLMSIGRNTEAQRMVESAYETNPEDPDVTRAKEKLIS